MAILKTDTDTLTLALLEQPDKWYRDLNSSRFLSIQADSTTLEVEKDTITLQVLHDGDPENN